MTYLRAIAFLSAGALLSAQGTAPKPEPTDYPAHTAADNGFTIAAEYLVHSIPSPNVSLVANDYLVVDVAVFGPAKAKLNLTGGNFLLRINGQKTAISPDAPSTVAISMKYSDWTQRPTVSGGVGAGAGDVTWEPSTAPRFPGDASGRPPLPNPVPSQTDPNVPGKEPEIPIEARIQRVALESGIQILPKSGLLFFPWHGRMKSLKSLELIYQGPAGNITLKLL